jgi:hypothetical protein
MRPRFSLRTLIAAITLLAIFLYYWIIMPTQRAQRFIRAVNSQDLATIEKLSSEVTLAKWKDERWGLTIEAKVAAWSMHQLLSGKRIVILHMKYFQLDHNYEIEMQLAATSLDVKKPDTVIMDDGTVIDTSQRIKAIR